jgi:8-oxo-dGTP pyrophosphatase MutT (NUDIX family)
MRREFSAGGVAIRRLRGELVFAAIRPRGKKEGIWALPKGLIAEGETPDATALRETEEEAGIETRLVTKLGDIRYVYTWEGERVFKVVSFYLLRYSKGRLGAIEPEMRIEVDEACWLPLEDGPNLLAYGGERQMVEKALAFVRDNGL